MDYNNLNNKNMQKHELNAMSDIDPLKFDVVNLKNRVLAIVSKSPEKGTVYNVLPRLCRLLGSGACRETCQLPEDVRRQVSKRDASCAQGNLENTIDDLGVKPGDLYMGAVCGGTEIYFTDEHNPAKKELTALPKTDAVVGYEDTVKACRLADCGLLVVHGVDVTGREFSGFIHATRLNMNGDDQFELDGQPVGGVEKMLKQVVDHYNPQEISVNLVSGIIQNLYTFTFDPSEKELEKNPTDTADKKRERLFKGWSERGWMTQQLSENGTWDGRSWDVDMYAAVRHQVEQAGLGEFYSDDQAIVNGDTDSGHASNRFGKLGKIEEARDLYVVKPIKYKS